MVAKDFYERKLLGHLIKLLLLRFEDLHRLREVSKLSLQPLVEGSSLSDEILDLEGINIFQETITPCSFLLG